MDNETDTLSSVDDGVPQLPEIAGHIERTPTCTVFAPGHYGPSVVGTTYALRAR